MKLLLETEGINSVIDETSSDSDPNVVVVGTYNDISPNYYDVRICHCVHSSISFSLNSILLVFLLIVFLQAVLSPQESFSIHLSHLLWILFLFLILSTYRSLQISLSSHRNSLNHSHLLIFHSLLSLRMSPTRIFDYQSHLPSSLFSFIISHHSNHHLLLLFLL